MQNSKVDLTTRKDAVVMDSLNDAMNKQKESRIDVVENLDISESSDGDLFDKCKAYFRATNLQQKGIYPYYMQVEEVLGSKVIMEGKQRIMLGGNNYLGIADHPLIKKAAKKAIDKYGVGSTGSRIIAGSFDLHKQLEKKISDFFGFEESLIFTTGYQTNTGVISCLVGRHEYVVLDAQAHASIVDGARMSFGRLLRFRHNDASDLERVLSGLQSKRVLTVVDGVYSMGGDIVDLQNISAVCKKYKSKLMVDEAHGFGVFGPSGRGVAEHFNLLQDIDIIVATFSKSCGSQGGFVSAKKEIINFIKHNARGLLFSTGMPAAIVAAADAAFSSFILKSDRRKVLWRNTNILKDSLRRMGFDLGSSVSPIIPVCIKDDVKTTTFWKHLFDMGIFVGAMIPPAVPPNESLLRISCSANLSEKDLDYILSTFRKIGSELGFL